MNVEYLKRDCSNCGRKIKNEYFCAACKAGYTDGRKCDYKYWAINDDLIVEQAKILNFKQEEK